LHHKLEQQIEHAGRGSRTGDSEVNNSFFEPVDEVVEARTQAQRLVELVDLHRSALVKYVNRILNCAEDAEDVVQETCVRLMRVQDLWRGEREVRAFLFKIATNLARDELRRRRTRCHGMHLPHDSLDLVGEEQQPEEIVDRCIALEVIANALSSLPPRYRQVFSLHVDEEMSYRAIARQLGISTKTVERDMSGAQELCQDRLKARRAVAA
jgi:RNA polymerase sigma factor (sigma-70 family)